MQGMGDFIGGRFLGGEGEALRSVDPATGSVVCETAWSADRADQAVGAAEAALDGWRALSLDARAEHLARFREAIVARKEPIAEAISLEMGKLRTEARTEVAALVGRFDLMLARIRSDMRDGALAGHPMEALVHRPHGVVGVVGPFNFPLHLCHAHVVPALLLGNTVVMKPSERTPLAGQRYAEAAEAAGLPAGVLNVVNGAGALGARLLQAKALRALCFTGSWPTGRRILESLLDRPEVLVALEMGGKNASVVLDDADLRQAAHEIIVGKYLTTGQRCTCTDRVLVHRSRYRALVDALVPMVKALRFGAQDDASAFAGPMASVAAREQFERALERARAGGATELARGVAPDGHAFAPPTLFALPDGVHHIDGYTNHELFGPNLHIEPVDSDEDAIAVLNASPVALAISVFTGDEARYARFVSATDTAIVNLNRSTNQASPRLPFGGTGTAGNFRPAGAHAPRNLAVPVATQRKVRGALVPDPKLAATLPTPDLDALEAQHGMEECKEAGRSPVEQRRPMSPRLPEGGRIAQSEQWLERLYGEGRMPMEKKPGVFDHLRSHGPWMVSVDDAPLSVLDAMSQTATLPAGFAHDEVVRCYIEGAFGDTLLHADDTTVGEHPAAVAYANFLRSRLRGLPHVSFVSSGAEANDKAYALAMAHRRSDKQRRLLAFEGSFHGRTLLPLQASHNPAKRAPFEFKGYEVEYASYAAWWTPDVPEPEDPENFVARVASGELGAVLEENLNGGDRLFVEELQSLVEVDRHLGTGDFFAAVIEPIQSEGGDRYATARFHRGLRALTRRHGVPLIYDEVQSGFGLGGTFAWHARFKLEKADGTPDTPDMVLFAKRAQVGVVMSAFEDPEPTYAHTASLVRGLIHAQSVADDQAEARGIEREVRERLEVVAKRYPMLVSRPRVTGYAVAFDLPSTDHLNRFLAQRFWRGVVVFAAGTRTVRYRLSRTFGTQEIETLFDAMDRSLAWLHANPGHTPPAWLDVAQFKVELDEGRDDVRVRRIRKDEADAVLEAVLELEARVYEPARRDDPAWLRMAFEEDGIAVVAEANVDGGWKLIGSALAAPLERAEAVEGPDRDPMLGKENTAYSLAITMDPEWRGIGLGRTLKREELRAARELRRADGAPRYRFLTGRNRMDQTAAMARINRSFGAHEVVVLDNQYGEASARASYYRIPLAAYAPVSRDGVHTKPPEGVDVASGLARPFRRTPESLARSLGAGLLYGPAVNKLTLVNYVTPAVVRAVEYVTAVAHRFPHLYLTSSRDETFDKTVRALRVHRKNAQVVIGLEGGYVGHTSAAARSLSDPSVHRQGPVYFDRWTRVPHPARVGVEAFEASLLAAIEAAGAAEQVLGMFVETVGERSGLVLDAEAARALDRVRAKTGVPVVFVESAGAQFRGGAGAFAGDALPMLPDACIWWGGGQVGFVHMGAKHYVGTPLTLVSTWDGDELSLVRVQHQLRAARRIDVASRARALDACLRNAVPKGIELGGQGLYRTVAAGDRAVQVLGVLKTHGVRARAFANGVLPVAPSLDVTDEELEVLAEALQKGFA